MTDVCRRESTVPCRRFRVELMSRRCTIRWLANRPSAGQRSALRQFGVGVLLPAIIMSVASCGSSAIETDESRSAPDESVRLAADVQPAPKPTSPLPPDTPCATPECHSRFLTEKHVHEPAASGACRDCHGPDTGEHHYPIPDGSDVDRCRRCHEVGGLRRHQHEALQARGCVSCHDPHIGADPALLREPTAEKLCASCHPKAMHRVEHAPFAAGECLACHEAHESQFAPLLRGGEGAEHCFMCHETIEHQLETATYRHAGLERQCRECHVAHSSDSNALLNASVDQVCLRCHAEILNTIQAATLPHPPVSTDDRCMTCHAPHVADHPPLLRDGQRAICLQCHDQPIVAADGRTIAEVASAIRDSEFVHGPVRADHCSACHGIHGGERMHMLRQSFPESFYDAFDVRDYALCFQCHEEGLVLERRTTQLTEFRQGDLNLHYVHVHRDRKGRTCRACHSIHGGDQPMLIAETIAFQGSPWLMPIRFELLEDGGSCAPGCHDPKTYRRSAPVEEEAPSTEEDRP